MHLQIECPLGVTVCSFRGVLRVTVCGCHKVRSNKHTSEEEEHSHAPQCT